MPLSREANRLFFGEFKSKLHLTLPSGSIALIKLPLLKEDNK
jgi:hypothetical protein